MTSRLLAALIALALAGCGQPAPIGTTPADAPAAEGTVTATGRLAPVGLDDRSLLAAVSPWTVAEIDHAVLTLSPGGTTLRVEHAMLLEAIAFTRLKRNTTYTLSARAYATSDDTRPIDNAEADPASCSTSFATTDDDAIAIGGIKLKLANRLYEGTGSSNLAVSPGGLAGPATPAIDAQSGVRLIRTYAGIGNTTFSGDGVVATDATLSAPNGGAAFDSAGNMYIADTNNHRIRRVDAVTKVITTVAGAGTAGYNGDGILATSATLNSPYCVTFDSADNMYIADTTNNRIRKVDAVTKIISTVAGNGGTGYNADGILATNTSIYSPRSVAIDAAGNLYIADTNNYRVRKVDAATQIISTVAGNGGTGYNGNGILATSATIYSPYSVAIDAAGNLYIADLNNYRIRKVDAATQIISTVAGNGGTIYNGDGNLATNTSLYSPQGVAVDGAGNLYIADTNNYRIRRVDAATQLVSTVAGTGTNVYSGNGGPAISAGLSLPRGVSVNAAGDVYVVEGTSSTVRRIDGATKVITPVAGTGGPRFAGQGTAATSALLWGPQGGAVDSAGNVYIADTNNDRIRKIDAVTKLITTVAGSGANGYGGDGGPALSASFVAPCAVAVDGAGNLYIADPNNHRIRRVDAVTKVISTFAGTGTGTFNGDNIPATNAAINGPVGVAVDGAGNLYIADTNNHRIRKVDAATKVISTIAGTGTAAFGGDTGPATSGFLSGPRGVAVDGAGNVYIADSTNGRIRRIDALTKVITTVAGSGTGVTSGDNGPATSAKFGTVFGVAVDGAGNLYFADASYHRIRRVDAATKIITSIAGTTSGFAGDGGPASAGLLSGPRGVMVDRSGNVYVVDTINYRIRILE